MNPEWNVCFDLPIVGVPLLECVCWDKDRFGKDYMGEFDIALEDIFSNGQIQQEVRMPILCSIAIFHCYPIREKREKGEKKKKERKRKQKTSIACSTNNATPAPMVQPPIEMEDK